MRGMDTLPEDGFLIDLAREIHGLAEREWGRARAVPMIGRHHRFAGALDRVARIAAADAPVLITGETGTGKELFARALFLLANRHRRVFVPVNCSQYTNQDVMASELFGHRRGSFTGATAEHRGVFEDNDGGTVFLDEVGELSPAAQAMLLRIVGDGEVVPVGGTRPKPVNVRVIAATNRDLLAIVREGKFREDLYFRLQRLKLFVPPLRERGRDWQLIANHFVERLTQKEQTVKRLASGTVARLDRYAWPGNVREVRGCIETGFYMSRNGEISLDDLAEALETPVAGRPFSAMSRLTPSGLCARMENGEGNFWDSVYNPFMARELNRSQVREVIAEGLVRADGSYKRLLRTFRIAETEYLKFMDFLRYHRLKPDGRWRRSLTRGESRGVAVGASNGR